MGALVAAADPTQVGTEKMKVGGEAEKASAEAVKCETIAVEVTQKQKDCERDLAAAIPAVEKAQAALDTLNKKDIGELKALAKPPSGVDEVLECVLLLQHSAKGKCDISWPAAKIAMNNPQRFLDELMAFKDKIDNMEVPKKNIEACRPYVALDYFTKEVMNNKSKAAGGMCDWVLNIVVYYDIVSDVEPKRIMLAEAQAQLSDANTKLAIVTAEVAELQAMLAGLEKEFEDAVNEKNSVIAEAEKCASKLDLANRLVNALASENVRWAAGIESLKDEMNVLVGDVLLSAAFVSYVGCFTKNFRDQLLKKEWIPYLVEHK